jgi:predicted ATPase
MSPAAVGALEQGSRRAPYRETIVRLANALGLPTDEQVMLEEAAERARRRRRNAEEREGRSNLPVKLTSFVERDDTYSIASLLTKHRLVTLTGSAGVGKTRTAIEIALRHRSPGDVLFVDLSNIRGRLTIVGEIATTFNVRLNDGGDQLEALCSDLKRQRGLVIIDNCEHVVPDVADIVLALLKAAPDLSIIATSRERLGLSMEVVYRLPSLEMSSVANRDEAAAPGSPALELFLDRARMSDSRIAFNPAELEIAAAICRDLDGIPLAIELAASRISALGLRDLRDRTRDLSFTSDSKDLPARQKTMLKALSWSFDLLSSSEQLLLRRLSTFAGGFTLDAAAAVCADDSLPNSHILDLVEQLSRKSLIEGNDHAESRRYSMLGCVRTFGLDRLFEAGEQAANAKRHTDWLIGRSTFLVENRIPQLPTLLFELDNIRSAIRNAMDEASEDGDVLAGEIVWRFRGIWLETGRPSELQQYCEALLGRLDEEKHLTVVKHLSSVLVFTLPGNERVEPSRHAIRLTIKSNDYDSAAFHSSHIALTFCKQGRFQEAIAEDALTAGYIALCDLSPLTQSTIANRVWILNECGDVAGARFQLAEFDRVLHTRTNASADFLVHRQTALMHRQAALIELEFDSGNIELAARLCIEALEDPSGDKYSVASWTLHQSFAACELALGHIDSAESTAIKTLSWWSQLKLLGGAQCTLEHLATTIALRGDLEFAATVVGSINTSYARLGFIRARMQRTIYGILSEALEAGLSQERIAALELVGSALSLDDALEKVQGWFSMRAPTSAA